MDRFPILPPQLFSVEQESRLLLYRDISCESVRYSGLPARNPFRILDTYPYSAFQGNIIRWQDSLAFAFTSSVRRKRYNGHFGWDFERFLGGRAKSPHDKLWQEIVQY